jgi:hypothetical protein
MMRASDRSGHQTHRQRRWLGRRPGLAGGRGPGSRRRALFRRHQQQQGAPDGYKAPAPRGWW